jgi:glycerol-3-phosphate dehydrogenase (NAD(P)+)
MKITVLGAGAWGTALARLLCTPENAVTLWGHTPQHLDDVRRSGTNQRYLPDVSLPKDLRLEGDFAGAVQNAECLVVAVPSKGFREVTTGLAGYTGIIVSVTKGIEHNTGLTMCGILSETAPQATHAALSGPTFASEVAREIPTAIVTASRDLPTAAQVQTLFNRTFFRVYTSADLLGVELGGALKNVIAIAAGIGDGLGLGENAKAALVTRAIVEIRRLGVACGAQIDTFTGLSGLGDLMVTCFSRQSRNRGFGERVGRGEKARQVADSMVAVAEGYPNARSAYHLARKHNIVSPLIDETYAMLYEDKDVRQTVRDLMSRDPKPEQ